jgi:hypothetical protein
VSGRVLWHPTVPTPTLGSGSMWTLLHFFLSVTLYSTDVCGPRTPRRKARTSGMSYQFLLLLILYSTQTSPFTPNHYSGTPIKTKANSLRRGREGSGLTKLGSVSSWGCEDGMGCWPLTLGKETCTSKIKPLETYFVGDFLGNISVCSIHTHVDCKYQPVSSCRSSTLRWTLQQATALKIRKVYQYEPPRLLLTNLIKLPEYIICFVAYFIINWSDRNFFIQKFGT